MDIGAKIKNLRLKYGLTQEELADRAELSKGFISQLERNLTSPSIITLIDILECLGTTPGEFFQEKQDEKIIFTEDDMFVKSDTGREITWLVPNAQKNVAEPIMLVLEPGASSDVLDPNEGEEFGYVLSGHGLLHIGNDIFKIRKGVSFYYKANETHFIENRGKKELRLIWVSTPPSF
ncbi:MAG: helix-turn-helix transcriptional regulator [Clostridia bacterium]|nr:helix-turn-helix transcriptional regulator [Clostridia bacterium]